MTRGPKVTGRTRGPPLAYALVSRRGSVQHRARAHEGTFTSVPRAAKPMMVLTVAGLGPRAGDSTGPERV